MSVRESPTTRLALIRHAPTDWNLRKWIQGQTDTRLVPEGRTLARTWGRRLQGQAWDRILASDLDRALESARLVNLSLNIPIHRDHRLREQDWGGWTGRSVAQLRAETPEALAEQEAAGWEFRPPGGENRLELLARSRQALDEAARNWPGQTILVVTHEGVIKSLLYHLAGRRYQPDEPSLIRPYHLHWLDYRRCRLQIRQVNALALPIVGGARPGPE